VIALELDRAQLGNAEAGLARLATLVADMTPVMDTIGALLVANRHARFSAGAGPGGVKWLPSLRAQAEGGQTMMDTGQLNASLAHKASRDQVEVGTNKIYAAVMQLGATIHARNAPNLKFKIGSRWVSKPSVTIPARPFIDFDAEDKKDVEALVVEELEKRNAS
jgi:phage gpG-like protein